MLIITIHEKCMNFGCKITGYNEAIVMRFYTMTRSLEADARFELSQCEVWWFICHHQWFNSNNSFLRQPLLICIIQNCHPSYKVRDKTILLTIQADHCFFSSISRNISVNSSCTLTIWTIVILTDFLWISR